MSRQLALSSGLSVLAMAAVALFGSPALANDPGLGGTLLAMSAACTPPSLGELLPLLAPGLQ